MRFTPTALTLLHALPPVPRTPPVSSALSPLYNFESDAASEALTAWERIDDVIMGGVSSSRLTLPPDGGYALFEGRLRSEGGGFCGQRMRLLAEPLDLSSADGMFIDCEALPIVRRATLNAAAALGLGCAAALSPARWFRQNDGAGRATLKASLEDGDSHEAGSRRGGVSGGV